MRKYLLPNTGTFYKANLHCHSRLSDADLTVEQLKEEYKARGYSIVAFSEHEVLFSHYDKLFDEDFIPITAYEVGVHGQGQPYQYKKDLHMNLFAKDPYNDVMPYFDPNELNWLTSLNRDMTWELADTLKHDGIIDGAERQLYTAKVNDIIRTANQKGFLVSLNHPNYSLLNCSDCIKYEGLWAVEVYNHSCFTHVGMPDDERVYDEILRSGRKIFATATDDNHNHIPFDDPKNDSFGGWTMIKAKNLDYASVIDAMEKGNFYASQGPEIKELYFEDGKIHIECSEARDICMCALTRQGMRYGSHNGDLTSADFEISDSLHGHVRFKVTDKFGKSAWTNPYYVKDFMEVKDHRVAII